MKYLLNIWDSIISPLTNAGINNKTNEIQYIRTKGINVFSLIILFLISTILFRDFSRISYADILLTSSFLILHVTAIFLNYIGKYKTSQILFNTITPIRPALTTIFYGLGVNVLLMPMSLIFGILCYRSKKRRNKIILWNFFCLFIGIVFFGINGSLYSEKVTMLDELFIIFVGLFTTVILFSILVLRLRNSADDVHGLLSSIIEDEAILVRKNKKLAQFNKVISNEIRLHLRDITSLQSELKTEVSQLNDEEADDLLQTANQSALQMGVILDELSQKVNLGIDPKTEISNCDLKEVLSQLITEIKIHPNYINSEIIIAGELPILKARSTPLKLLFQNLITNGLKYNRSNSPRVIIHSEYGNHHCKIMVQDNGIGMIKDQIESIFQPFQRLNNSGEFEGTGLGLSIVKRILENLDWEIEVQSAVGKGSLFILSIPRNQISSSSHRK